MLVQHMLNPNKYNVIPKQTVSKSMDQISNQIFKLYGWKKTWQTTSWSTALSKLACLAVSTINNICVANIISAAGDVITVILS